jgi:phosphate transport system substrate-binding protein
MLRIAAAILLLPVLALVLASQVPANADDIRVTGSSTIAPLVLEIARSFEAKYPGTRVFVETGGSGKGILDVRRGLADVAMISRAPLPDEIDLVAHTIARDGIALIVSADNPVSALTKEQIRTIFAGEFRNWSVFGGEDRGIVVVAKGEGRATSEVLNDFLGLTADQIRGDVFAAENAQMIKTVSVTPGSIGYVSIGAALMDIEFGVPIKLIGLGDIPPTAEAVADGSYEATRPLDLVTVGEPQGAVLDLIAFSSSPEVASIITSLTFVPASQ